MEDMVSHEDHGKDMANPEVLVEDICNNDTSMEYMASH